MAAGRVALHGLSMTQVSEERELEDERELDQLELDANGFCGEEIFADLAHTRAECWVAVRAVARYEVLRYAYCLTAASASPMQRQTAREYIDHAFPTRLAWTRSEGDALRTVLACAQDGGTTLARALLRVARWCAKSDSSGAARTYHSAASKLLTTSVVSAPKTAFRRRYVTRRAHRHS
jgi:hypothetical protein